MAVDMALANAGVAIVEHPAGYVLCAKRITTEQPAGSVAAGHQRRCRQMYRELLEISEEFKPKQIVVELPVGGAKSAKAAGAMQAASAVFACYWETVRIPVAIVSPTAVKRFLGVPANAGKKPVQDAVVRLLSCELPEKQSVREHVADALAAYIYWSQTQ